MAELDNPKLWMVVTLIWVIVVICIWKAAIGSRTDVRLLKIMATVFMYPIVFGICYKMFD